jgi:hypothetical protein
MLVNAVMRGHHATAAGHHDCGLAPLHKHDTMATGARRPASIGRPCTEYARRGAAAGTDHPWQPNGQGTTNHVRRAPTHWQRAYTRVCTWCYVVEPQHAAARSPAPPRHRRPRAVTTEHRATRSQTPHTRTHTCPSHFEPRTPLPACLLCNSALRQKHKLEWFPRTRKANSRVPAMQAVGLAPGLTPNTSLPPSEKPGLGPIRTESSSETSPSRCWLDTTAPS